MRNQLFLSCVVSLLLSATISLGSLDKVSDSAIVATQMDSSKKEELKLRSKFECLPADVRLNDVVTYGGTSQQNVTVEKTLIEMKAKCRSRKLVDRKRREIRFSRTSCWGNPPVDYVEIQRRENQKLQELKRRYTVIVLSCNPMIQ